MDKLGCQTLSSQAYDQLDLKLPGPTTAAVDAPYWC